MRNRYGLTWAWIAGLGLLLTWGGACLQPDALDGYVTSSEATPTVAAANRPEDMHLLLGLPAPAYAVPHHADCFLIQRPQYALSYNDATGTPNWVAWHLSQEWFGSDDRDSSFRPDEMLPNTFRSIRSRTYDRSGFDRGHLCPLGRPHPQRCR